MGALFSRNKNEGRKRTFKFWPSSHDQLNSTKSKGVNSPLNISKSQPLSTQNQQWTEVSLTTPTSDIFDNIEKDIITSVPIPPPRKHRNKTNSVKPVIEKITVEKSTKIETVDGGSPAKLIPVEETIIIPKKEPVHICDGTHHHVRNIVNGKVIHDTVITPKKNEEVLIEKEKITQPIEQTPKKEEKIIIRPKNLSTVSLPNYDELKIKTIKTHHEAKKKPKRHISVVSLPTHNKKTLSDATVARLENYMTRCKSFGALPPQELLEKLKTQLEFSSDSEESWDGVDDWDMEIIEHTGVKQSPLVPRSYIAVTEDSKVSVTQPANTNLNTNTNNNTNTNTSYTFHSYQHNDIRVPTPIEEDVSDEEILPPVSQGIITLKKRDGRRESIDDFFDSSGENPLAKALPTKRVNYLGRRGSDGFFGYNKANLLKDLSIKSGAIASDSMIEGEKIHTADLARRRKSAAAALHRIDSTEFNDEDDDNPGTESEKNSIISEERFSKSDDESKDSKRDSLNDNDDFVLVHNENISKTENKTEPTEHSNLLKFLKRDDSVDDTGDKKN